MIVDDRQLNFVHNPEKFEFQFVIFGESLKSIEDDQIDSPFSAILAFEVV